MSFSKDLSVSAELEKEVAEETAKTAVRIFRNLVIATPVDEGRARGNWQMSSSGFKEGEVDNVDKSGGSTINEGTKQANRATNDKYPTLYISNNVKYIERLNQGWSQQAPKKFVEKAIKQGLSK